VRYKTPEKVYVEVPKVVDTAEMETQTEIGELNKMKQLMRSSFMIALEKKKADEAEI
jgi:hypothetical protein